MEQTLSLQGILYCEIVDIPTLSLPHKNKAEHHGIIVNHHLTTNESKLFQLIYLQLESLSHERMIPPSFEF